MIARSALRRVFGTLVGPGPPLHRLRVNWANGTSTSHYDDDQPPDVTVTFKSSAAQRRALVTFPVGFVDAYIAEQVDISGDRAVAKLFEMGYAANRRSKVGGGRQRATNPIVWAKQVIQEARQNNRNLARAKRNAVYHYGFDPKFFELFLDETVGYSEGYWPPGTETLNQAKYNNYDYVCRKLRLSPGDRVVDVGSGWGYMPLLMAERYGAEVTVYNPVPRQNGYMQARFERHGYGDKIRILEKDHRELSAEPEAYDRYVSIGVYEHVGADGYRDWISSIATALKPDGIGVVSTTGKMFKEMTNYLVLKYIFPGGHVPSLPQTLKTMDECGLTVLNVENLWPHYARTADAWLSNFESRWPRIREIDPDVFDERFYRIWRMYLSGTPHSFRNHLDLFHIVFVKGRKLASNASMAEHPDVEEPAMSPLDFPLYR